jgi:phage shock protein C
MGHDGTWRTQRFYRDPRHGKLMGVCAGVADYLGVDVTLIRILAIIALLWFNVLALVAYLVLGFMLPTRPDTLYDRDTDEEYRRSVWRSASGTFRDVHDRCCELDMKLQRMEGYVTSSRYDLDRQFRDLEH